MRAALLFVSVAGCNWVYGLTGSVEQPPATDAKYFDAMVDAPFACPPIGHAPTFAHLLRQQDQNCVQVTLAGDWETGVCSPSYNISAGMADSTLEPIPATMPSGYDQPRLAPEGDALFAVYKIPNAAFGVLQVYARSGTTWTLAFGITSALGPWSQYIALGTPSRAPNRRLFVFDPNGGQQVEYEIDDQNLANAVHAYTPADLGLISLQNGANLSPDGLRVVYVGQNANFATTVMYADRASLTDMFTAPQPLMGVPGVSFAFMTADCARVYFWAADHVLWVQQDGFN